MLRRSGSHLGFLAFMAVLALLASSPRTATIRGTVTIAGTGELLPGVEVTATSEDPYAPGEEYVAFLKWDSHFKRFARYVGPIFMFPVLDGRVFWKRDNLPDVPGIQDGMTVESFFAGLRALPAGDLGIQWIEVEAGTVTMGSADSAAQVPVDRFSMSATEITFDQYDAFCDATGRRKPDDNGWGRGAQPVLNVSYDDAVAFCEWLSAETGRAVRLPNEAEWVYAAQGGRHSGGFLHSGGDDKDEVSWNLDNSGNRPHPVGTKKPNELGLFDTSGNLWEWCTDSPELRSSGSQAGPRISGSDDVRPVYGDSFDNPGTGNGYRLSVRLDRDSRHINIGFRVARSD